MKAKRTIQKKSYSPGAVLGLLLFLSSGGAWAEPLFKVGFVVPSDRDDPFFSQVYKAMQAAASDLNIELVVEFAGRSMPMYARRHGYKMMKSHKPNYFVTGNWPGAAKYHLQEAEELGIKTFVINSPMGADTGSATGDPRDKLSGWLGQMSPNNFEASYLLTDILIKEARERKLVGIGDRVGLIALSGNMEDATATNRLGGLKTRIDGNQDAVLREVVLAGWQKDTAYRETLRLLEQFPDTGVIWAASDLMAQGAAEAAEKAGKKAGEDIVIGGFDWNNENLRDIEKRRLTASVGGHVLEGAWALVLLYDYHKGLDFARELGVSFESSMYAITTGNIEQYTRLAEGMDWDRIDFTRFSKALNPKIDGYDFSLPMLFKALADDTAVADNSEVDVKVDKKH